MNTSLTIVSAKGHYEYCAAYLSKHNNFDKNVLLIINFRGGIVAEQILSSDSIDVFDEIHTFEPVPDSTHGLNEKAMRRTVEKYLEFEKAVISNYNFQALLWGVVTILPIYNFLYHKISLQNPDSKRMMMDEGTASYMLNNKKLFKYMIAPTSRGVKKLSAQLIKKEIDFFSFARILFSKMTGCISDPKYGNLFEYEINTPFNVAVVRRKDLFKKPSFMEIESVEEFLPSIQKAGIETEEGFIDSEVPILIDQNFGVPIREHVKILDQIFFDKGIGRVCIKPHPKERSDYISVLQNISTHTVFSIVGARGDAEEIVRAFNVNSVLGFNSTALFNLLEETNVDFIFRDYLKHLPLRLYAQLFPRIIFMAIVYNEMVSLHKVGLNKISLRAIHAKRLLGMPFYFGRKVYRKLKKVYESIKGWVDESFIKKLKRSNTATGEVISKGKENFSLQYGGEIEENLVFFESFNGRYACSPKAIFESLSNKESFSDTHFIWAVSKDMDEGAQYKLKSYPNVKAVSYGSKQYKEAISKAKVIVTNSRLPRYFLKKEGQIVLQTWHGTPFKKDAMSILTSIQQEQLNRRRVVNDADVSNYTYLLAQNEFSVECFKDTFDVSRHPHVRILNTGYPRNDRLVSEKNDSSKIAQLKERFSLPLDKKIILFAPTWRDHHKKKSKAMAKYWDFNLWQERLGDAYHVIFRGHYFFTDAVNLNAYSGFITDISKHNDINDLFLISDILITDYSSCMFDFSVLEKPMYFFMPDLMAYTHLSRRLHLDPYTELPGPVYRNNIDLIEGVINNEASMYKNAYSDFLKRFNCLDDGKATDRAISLIESAKA